MKNIRKATVTIANGAALSDACDLTEAYGKLVAIQPDSAWDTNTMTFQVSHDDGANYADMYCINGGAEEEYKITGVVASKYMALGADIPKFFGATKLKVRSGTTGSPVNQSGATVVTLIFWQTE